MDGVGITDETALRTLIGGEPSDLVRTKITRRLNDLWWLELH